MQRFGTDNRGKENCEEFKLQGKQHDVLCRSDYADTIVSSFSHQIKSEYYGGNRSVSIEGIVLENFSASNQSSSSFPYEAVSRQTVFNYFISDDSKQDAATTATSS